MGEMPARLDIRNVGGDGDIEIYVDDTYVLGATYDQLGRKGLAAVTSAARHVTAALATPAPRPKLEIVRTEDAVDIWLGGKIVSQHIGHLAKLEAVEETARDIARALGADVERTDDPAPQRYVYFISYAGLEDAGQSFGSCWIKRDTPIEFGDTEAIRQDILKNLNARGMPFSRVEDVSILNFILTDGPS